MNQAAALLKSAQEAADRGDVLAMLEALATSGYLEGLTRRLQKKWGDSLPGYVVDDCVAEAVDAAFATLSQDGTIQSLGAWLWKSADRIASDRWRFDYSLRSNCNDDTLPSVQVNREAELARERLLELEEIRHGEAIRIARRLLPLVGGGQLRDVMELLIDAAEDRLPDLPASSIAQGLGISNNAARALVSRGLKRLGQLAELERVESPIDFLELDMVEEEHFDE